MERKGFHRVIELLPDLLQIQPDLRYLIVGGTSPEGDMREELLEQVRSLNLEDRVHFLGSMPAAEIRWPLSAADVFVLATSNEGWANVFLEAMACGLPVVTTDVGGNAEVVCKPEVGTIVPFGDKQRLLQGIATALDTEWDRAKIRLYAEDNRWESRVSRLRDKFIELVEP